MSTKNSNQFGPVRRSLGIPKRLKRKKESFDWSSDAGTTRLLLKLPDLAENTFHLFTGIPLNLTNPALIRGLASTLEAQHFVEHIEQNIRNLTTGLVEEEIRSAGELHGSIKWSETLSWRSTSLGADHFYVTKTQVRSYNCPENRVAVAALYEIAKSVPAVLKKLETTTPAVATANKAEQLLQQKPLKDVPVLPTSKITFDKKRTRLGRNAALYAPALKILDMDGFEQNETLPVGNDMVYLACDEQTKVTHRLVVELNNYLEDLEMHPVDLSIDVNGDSLTLGSIVFRGGSKDGYVIWNDTLITVHGSPSTRTIKRSKKKTVSISHPEDLFAFVAAATRHNKN